MEENIHSFLFKLKEETVEDNVNLISMTGGKWSVGSSKLSQFFSLVKQYPQSLYLVEKLHPEKAKFVIDIDNPDGTDWFNNDIKNQIMTALSSLITRVYNVVPEVDFMFNDKFPLQKVHIYVHNLFTNSKERKALWLHLQKLVPILRDRIDLKLSGFRMLGQYKPIECDQKTKEGNSIFVPAYGKGCYLPEGKKTRAELTLEDYRKYSLLLRHNNPLNDLLHCYKKIIYPAVINYRNDDEDDDDNEQQNSIIQIPEADRPAIISSFLNVADPDSCRMEWSRLIRSLFNLGATIEQIHQWSSISKTKYDNNAKRCINKLTETEFCGIPCLLSHLKSITSTPEIKSLRTKLISYLPKRTKPFNINEYLLKPNQLLPTGLNQVFYYDIDPKDKLSKYVRPLLLERLQIVNSPLGSGKTTALTTYIGNIPANEKVIIITPRRAFAKFIHLEMKNIPGHKFYSYLEDKAIHQHNNVIIQVESLHKLNLKMYDHVIMDECESILSQLTSLDTQKNNITENHLTFMGLLENSKSIIMCDAFVSERTIHFCNHLNLPYILHDYSAIAYKPRTYTHYRYISKKQDEFQKWCSDLIYDLQNDKKLFIFVSSKNKLQRIVHNIHKHTSVRGIEYYSGKALQGEIKDIWNNPDIRYIITTSTITVGCNFPNRKVFDRLYIYASSSSENMIRDIFQASMRVRNINDNHLVLYTDDRTLGKFLPCIKKYVEDDVAYQLFYLREYFGDKYKVTRPILKDLFIYNQLEHNQSIMYLNETFDIYMEMLNYSRSPCNQYDDIMMLESNDYEPVITNYLDIPEIYRTEYENLKNQSNRTPDMEKQLEKFYFQSLITTKESTITTGELMNQLWKVFQINKNKIKFRNAAYEKGVKENLVTIDELKHYSTKDLFDDKLPQRIEHVRDLCEYIELEHSHAEQNFTKQQLEEIPDNFCDKLRVLFGYKDCRKIKTEWSYAAKKHLVQHVLSDWGLTKVKTVKKTRRNEDGVRHQDEMLATQAEIPWDNIIAKKTPRMLLNLDE